MPSPTLAVTRALFIALAVLWLGWLPCAAADSAVRETTLPNGLKVITKEIHDSPVVSVWTYYRAGSRNERPGITGISHLIEHMMFKGTPTLKRGETDRLTALAGGKNNAFTDTDYTAYYFALPSESAAPQGRAGLETVLRIEADRMRNCLMDPKELAHETQVVLSELEGNENSPLNRLDQAVKAAAFAVHPYHWPVIGWKCDVQAITRSDVLNYYRTYYAPNNAFLVLVGDFDTARTLGLVRELFGAIPRGVEPPKVASPEPEQEGERRVMVKGEGGAVYFEALYRVPATPHPDMHPLGVLDSLLTVGRSSRLYRALVASGLATEIVSSFSQQKDPGWDTIFATCPVNVDRQKFERALDAAIGELQDHLVSPAELAKARRQTITQTVFAMDGVSDQGMLLGVYEIVANWPYLLTMNQHTERVTAQQIRAAARKYLTPDNRTIGWFVPTKVTKEAPAVRGKPGPISRRIGPCARDGVTKLQIPNSKLQGSIKLQTPNGAQANPPADVTGQLTVGRTHKWGELPSSPGVVDV
ncbi:MAG: insulinase family protein, partial [Verrucomicrobia bacterium]|nr:insulinase family protein [Verrucomicrobiota bacterium]